MRGGAEMIRPGTLRAAIAHSQRKTSADTSKPTGGCSEGDRTPMSQEKVPASRDADAK